MLGAHAGLEWDGSGSGSDSDSDGEMLLSRIRSRGTVCMANAVRL